MMRKIAAAAVISAVLAASLVALTVVRLFAQVCA